jgi:hypothetical protein
MIGGIRVESRFVFSFVFVLLYCWTSVKSRPIEKPREQSVMMGC